MSEGQYTLHTKIPAGAFLYALGQDGNTVAVMQRDHYQFSDADGHGKLSYMEVLRNNVGNTSSGANFGLFKPDSIVTLAHDISSVYVGSSFDSLLSDNPGGFVTLHNNAEDSPILPPIESHLQFRNIPSVTIATGSGDDQITVHNVRNRGRPSACLDRQRPGFGDAQRCRGQHDGRNWPRCRRGARFGTRVEPIPAGVEGEHGGGAHIDITTGDGADAIRISQVANFSTVTISTEGPTDDPDNNWVDQIQVSGRDLGRGSQVTVDVGNGGAGGDEIIYEVGGNETFDANATELGLDGFGSLSLKVGGVPTPPLAIDFLTADETVVAATAGTVSINEGEALTLDGSASQRPTDLDAACATDPLCDVSYIYAWDLNADGLFTELVTDQDQITLSWQDLLDFGFDVSNTFGGGAQRRVTLQVARVVHTLDGTGGVTATETQFSDDELVVTIQDVRPVVTVTGDAQVSAEPDGALYTLSASATDPGGDEIVKWEIDWNDGTSETFILQTVFTHFYQRRGSYEITVTGFDQNGMRSQPVTSTVAVDFAGESFTIDEGQSLLLDAAAFGLPDADSYVWSFSQSGGTELPAAAGGSVQTLDWNTLNTLGVTNDGEFDIKLSATYGTSTEEATTTLTVENVAPSGVLENSGPVNQGQATTLRFVDLADPNDLDSLQFSYDFGNGFVPGEANQPVPSSLSAGTHVITGRIDDGTDTTDYETTLTILDLPPELAAEIGSAGQVTVLEGDTALLSGTFINPGGGSPIFTSTLGSVTQDTAAGTWTWTYTPADDQAAAQPVTITVTDGDNSSDTFTFDLVIENVAPTIVTDSDFSVPTTSVEGSPVTVSFVNVFDPSSADTVAGFSYRYDFGDGNGFVSGSASQQVPAAVVADSGEVVIRAQVQDKDGGFTQYSRVLVVQNSVATIDSLALTPQQIGSVAPITLNGTFAGDAGVNDTHTVVIDWGDGYIDRLTQSNVLGITAGGSGYADATAVPVTGGSGNGMTIDIGTQNGAVIEVVVRNPGTGYQTGDLLTVSGGDGDARLTVGAFDQSARTFTAIHSYAYGSGNLANPTMIRVTVSDDDGGQDERILSAAVVGAPHITSESAIVVLDQQTSVMDIEAFDPDGDTEGNGLTYRLSGGADQSFFSIDIATGVLTFQSAPDANGLANANQNNVYEVQVTVTNSDGLTDVQDIAVTVKPNHAPIITSEANVSVTENETFVIDIGSIEFDGDTESSGLTYSLTGGADQDLFSIVPTTGVLTFKVGPNFETPQDAGVDNVYEVFVTVTDSAGLTDSQRTEVTVQDANDAPHGIDLHGAYTKENLTGLQIGQLEAIDEDAGGSYVYSVNDPRFEVVGDVLSLKQDVSLNRDDSPDITFEIIVTESADPSKVFTQSFTLPVEENARAWQNPGLAWDVNDSGFVSSLDALLLINSIRKVRVAEAFPFEPNNKLARSRPFQTNLPFYDPSGDGNLTALDILLVINYLSKTQFLLDSADLPTLQPEGEQIVVGEKSLPMIEISERPQSSDREVWGDPSFNFIGSTVLNEQETADDDEDYLELLALDATLQDRTFLK